MAGERGGERRGHKAPGSGRRGSGTPADGARRDSSKADGKRETPKREKPKRGTPNRDRATGSGGGQRGPSKAARASARSGPPADQRRGRSGGKGADRTGKTPNRTGRTDAHRAAEPPLPAHVDLSLLDRSVRAQLRSLSKANAEIVAGHLVVAGQALESSPATALAHARAARSRAARVGVVREAVGIAAYHAQQWSEALAELRAARRISGDPANLAVIADCERALGRASKAVRVLSDPDVGRLEPAARVELLIVVAGARRDLGQSEAALAVLARGGLDTTRPRPGSVRLWYAYGDLLEELDRSGEAAKWFAAAAELDVDGETDAADRAAALL